MPLHKIEVNTRGNALNIIIHIMRGIGGLYI